MQRVMLLFSWSELVCSSPGYSSMSLVVTRFWHAAGTGHTPRCELRARPCSC
jgi:hypothetical protein